MLGIDRAGYYTTYFEHCAIKYTAMVLWQNSVHILYCFVGFFPFYLHRRMNSISYRK